MDIIINKPQLVRVVLLYLNKYFGNLTQKTSSKYPDSVFYVNSDNEVLMEYDKEFDKVYLEYTKIWEKIQYMFSLDYMETRLIMDIWLEETYKLKGIRPLRSNLEPFPSWTRLTNSNDLWT